MALGTAIDETRGRIASRCRHGPSSRPTPRSLPCHPAPVRGQGPQGDERPLLSHMDITGRQIRRTGIHPSEPLRSRTAEDGFGSGPSDFCACTLKVPRSAVGSGSGRPEPARPMSQLGRLRRFDSGPANGRNRRISPVAAHSGDRLLSEPTAGTQPCRREPLFMPQSRPPQSSLRSRCGSGGHVVSPIASRRPEK
jgi:hypothetical protein